MDYDYFKHSIYVIMDEQWPNIGRFKVRGSNATFSSIEDCIKYIRDNKIDKLLE